MIRLIFILAVIVLVVYAIHQFKKNRPAINKKRVLQILTGALLLLCLLLVVTGRASWIAALAAGLFALAQKVLPWLLRFFPLWQQHARSQKASQGEQDSAGRQNDSPQGNSTLNSRQEALKVLGLEEGASDEEIVLAHRKLIQKLHPDRGGSDYLAARVNEAKRLLLGK